MPTRRACSEELSQRSAGDERQLARLRDYGAALEHVETLALDGVKDFEAAAGEKFDINSEVAADLLRERQAAPEPLTRALDFEAHEFQKFVRGAPAGDDRLFYGKAAKVFERKIDAALAVINGDVLPEIRELERGTGEVGELLAVGIAISAN